MGGGTPPALTADTLGRMDKVYQVIIVLHLLSWALVLGGWFATIRKPQVTPGMMHGSFVALLFGFILMGMAISMKPDPNHMKLGIKGVIAIVIVVLLAIAKRQLAAVSAVGAAEVDAVPATSESAQSEAALAATTSSGSRVLINLAGVLVIVNVAIAVIWQ